MNLIYIVLVTVTRPSTNWARRRLTSFIETNMLPLCQTSTSVIQHDTCRHNCTVERRLVVSFCDQSHCCCTSVLIGSAAVRCRSSDKTLWSPPLINFQSSRRPLVAMCYCRRSVICYCRPSTLEKSTCWRPVCLVTYNISSEAENSFISAILPRHCVI